VKHPCPACGRVTCQCYEIEIARAEKHGAAHARHLRNIAAMEEEISAQPLPAKYPLDPVPSRRWA
jgi:hypothetical protein